MRETADAAADKLRSRSLQRFVGNNRVVTTYTITSEDISDNMKALSDNMNKALSGAPKPKVPLPSVVFSVVLAASECVFMYFSIKATFVGFSRPMSDVSAWYINWVSAYMWLVSGTEFLNAVGLLLTGCAGGGQVDSLDKVKEKPLLKLYDTDDPAFSGKISALACPLIVSSAHVVVLGWTVPRAWALTATKCWALTISDEQCALADTMFDVSISLAIGVTLFPLVLCFGSCCCSWLKVLKDNPSLAQALATTALGIVKVLQACAIYSIMMAVAEVDSTEVNGAAIPIGMPNASDTDMGQQLTVVPDGDVLVCISGPSMGVIEACTPRLCNEEYCKFITDKAEKDETWSPEHIMSWATGLVSVAISAGSLLAQYKGATHKVDDAGFDTRVLSARAAGKASAPASSVPASSLASSTLTATTQCSVSVSSPTEPTPAKSSSAKPIPTFSTPRDKRFGDDKTAIYDYKSKKAPADNIPHAAVATPLASVEIVRDLFGVQNVLQTERSSKSAVLLAGNSGLPGGAVGRDIKLRRHLLVDSLKGHDYKTQEEDVVKSWLLTELDRNKTNIETSIDLIWGKYGMIDFNSPDKKTIQKVNYTNLTKSHPELVAAMKLSGQPFEKLYADALVVRNALLSPKLSRKPDTYDFSKAIATTLVFVAGPNVGAKGNSDDPHSTTLRTFNHFLSKNYHKFRDAVKWTYYAALHAMAMEGRDVALLCWVSGDLYAGDFKEQYGVKNKSDDSELRGILDAVLDMECLVQGTQATLRQCFRRVVVVTL